MSREVRSTVEVVLTKELFGATGSAPQLSLSAEGAYLDDYDREGAEREVFPYGEGALGAIEELGLLPASEAAEWRQRFELARTGWSTGPVASPEQKRLAEEHLDSLVRSLAVAPDTESRGAMLERFNSAFALYLHTGLERTEDAPRWGERLEKALGRTVEEFELVEVAGLDPAELDEPGGEEPAPMGAHYGSCRLSRRVTAASASPPSPCTSTASSCIGTSCAKAHSTRMRAMRAASRRPTT